MSNGCPTCKAVLCCDDDPFVYSLVRGRVYENDQVSVNFECPEGLSCQPGIYTIHAGTIQLPITGGSPLRLQCCQNEVVQNVPANATEEEIGEIAQAMVNECARQLALCTANRTVRTIFMNEEVTSNPCESTGRLVGWLGPTPPTFNPVISIVNGVFVMQPGVFSAPTRTQATNLAQTFLDNFATSLIFQGELECGYWNEELICPDSDPPVTVPAFTAFSNISQEQANQNAIDATCASVACLDQIATAPVGGIFGTSVIRGRGGFSDKMYAALGTGGIAQIDTATNTVDWEFVFPAQIHVLAVRDNGLIYAIGDLTWYIFDPAFGGSITYNDTYPSGISLGFYSCTPWNPNGGGGGGSVCVVCYGDTGSGNKYHIVELPLGAPSVVFSASTGFDIISSPGSYDEGRDQYNFKIRDSTLYPGTPERIVTFNSSFTIINSAVMNTIYNGDGLFYSAESDTLYYYGRNTLGDGLYPVNPVSLAFGAQIVSLGGFPSGQFGYDSTNGVLGVIHNSLVVLVDVFTNNVECSNTVPSSNNNGLGMYPPDKTLYVKTDASLVDVRKSVV